MTKNILITGAASGIGRETALFFAKNGWFVGAVDLNGQGLESLEKEIGRDQCHTHSMDVTDPESVREAVTSFGDRTGGTMDVLFNNAGILKFGRFEKVDLAHSLAIVDVNLKGVIACTHSSLYLLKNTPGSRVVNMASTSAVYGIPDLSVYSATKRAVLALTEALDIELEPYGISVCDVLAPYVNTPLLETDQKVHSINKMGIKLAPIDVAKTVWKAAHKKKLHWKMGGSTHALVVLFNLLPGLRRPIVKSLTISA